MSFGSSKQKSSSKPLTPDEVGGYFEKLDSYAGGSYTPGTKASVRFNPETGQMELVPGTPGSYTPGRLGEFAKTGTPAVDYQALTPEQLKALGGAGATRTREVDRARAQAIEELNADPSLNVFQRQRARQLTDADYQDRLDAIAKETEAGITNLAGQEAGRKYESELTKSKLTREDLEALAAIFFGGKGQTSSSKGSQFNFGSEALGKVLF